MKMKLMYVIGVRREAMATRHKSQNYRAGLGRQIVSKKKKKALSNQYLPINSKSKQL
jgi:hypothetical protein